MTFSWAVRHRKWNESLDFEKMPNFSPTLLISVQALQRSIFPALYNQCWSASSSGYKKSRYTRKLRFLLRLVYGSAGRSTIPVSMFPKSFPWERCSSSYLWGSCYDKMVLGHHLLVSLGAVLTCHDLSAGCILRYCLYDLWHLAEHPWRVASIRFPMDTPTILRPHRSMTPERYSQPSSVGMYVMSLTIVVVKHFCNTWVYFF